MNALLPLSGLIDRINNRIGQLIRWFVLAAVLISALNAIVRKAFNFRSKARNVARSVKYMAALRRG